MTQASIGGEALRLHRRIEAPIGGTALRIEDRVVNLAAEPQPHEILYHFNLGFPALGEGTVVELGDRILAGPMTVPDPEGEPIVECHASSGSVPCVVATPLAGTDEELRMSLAFDIERLPFFQVWRDLRPHRCVLGVEPCSSDRPPDGTTGGSVPLPGGAKRDYRLTFSVTCRKR